MRHLHGTELLSPRRFVGAAVMYRTGLMDVSRPFVSYMIHAGVTEVCANCLLMLIPGITGTGLRPLNGIKIEPY